MPSVPVIVFAVLAASVAWVVHSKTERLVLGCFVAGLVSTVLFLVLGSVIEGYVDPFWPIALVFGTMVGAGVAAVVGVFFQLKRRRRKRNPVENGSGQSEDEKGQG
jgi:CHASE2 domain-containing sensor protein